MMGFNPCGLRPQGLNLCPLPEKLEALGTRAARGKRRTS